jgi:hypothetical protein
MNANGRAITLSRCRPMGVVPLALHEHARRLVATKNEPLLRHPAGGVPPASQRTTDDPSTFSPASRHTLTAGTEVRS